VSVVVVGINDRTVPLAALEPIIVAPPDLPKALADLSSRPRLDEVVLLSTCVRTEVYAVVSRIQGAMADIREFFAAWSGQPPEEFTDSLYSYFEEAAVNHLFRVASGLDSAALGEPEVLGQVRQAWEVARSEGACGEALGAVFRHAVEVGKRARAETTISRGTTSLCYAAVEMASAVLGGLDGKQALVVGLGEVGEVVARAFSGAPGAPAVMLANRTGKRAEEVALALRGRAVPWEDLALALAEADVVASCAGGPEKLFSVAAIEVAVATSGGKPLLLVDLAMPRDFDPAAAKLGAVKLLDMDDISALVAARVGGRRAEVPTVERIVADEVDRYRKSVAARTVAPLVSALRGRAEEIRQSEFTRAESRLAQLGPLERDALENMTRRIVAKLLHDPTVNLKAAAGTAQGEALAQAFRDLFGLEA
jgi:glutamyl-tRNA reductase